MRRNKKLTFAMRERARSHRPLCAREIRTQVCPLLGGGAEVAAPLERPDGQSVENLCEELARVNLQHARQLNEFDNVDSPFASLHAPHEGAWSLKTRG